MAYERLVVARSYFDPQLANIAVSILRDAGIESFLWDQNTGQSAVGYSVGIGGIRIAVPESNLSEAIEILNQIEENENVIEGETIRCPKCNSSLVSNSLINFFSPLIILFIITSNSFTNNTKSRYYKCKRCKYRWNENKRQ